MIGGGGATGIECSREMPGFIEKLCVKYNYPRHQVEITVLEGSAYLCGSGEYATQVIRRRFKKRGIKVLLSTFIKEVKMQSIIVEEQNLGKKVSEIPMDILMWTGGVKAHSIIGENFSPTAPNGAIVVNKFMQSEAFPFIFAAGDDAYVENLDKKPLPLLASIALQQGRIAGENIYAEIVGKVKKTFSPSFSGMIIPLGGKYALFKKGDFMMSGFLIWALRRLVDLRYALSILPFFEALRTWWHATNVFVEND